MANTLPPRTTARLLHTLQERMLNAIINPLTLRTSLSIDQPALAIPTVRRLTVEWLTKKFGSAPLASGHHQLDAISTLTNQVIYGDDGTEHAIRLQLREDQPNATWRTTITATTPPRSATAAVAVLLEAFPNPGHQVNPARPALVRKFVETLRPRDGLARLTLKAQEVGTDVEPLLHVLCDPARTLPVVVAARPLQPDPTWSTRMQKAMPHCAGAASLYLLKDADAVDAFRQEIGEHHRVAPGAVRTYLPDVDPAWGPDAARHRFLSFARMSDPTDTSWFGIARRVQQLANEAPVPEPLRHLIFPDAAQTHHAQRQAALTADRTSTELAALRSDITLLTGLLTQADTDLKEAARNAELSIRTIDSLESELQEANARALRDIEEALTAWDEVERIRGEADTLRTRLREAGRYGDTVVVEQATSLPQSFEELWERLGELERVLVTADRDVALALDESDRSRVWAAKAWNGLRFLDSYAHHPDFNGGVLQFCSAGIPGAVSWTHKQLATNEGKTTMDRWGGERIFPVPPEVDAAGRAAMKPHLKLDNGGQAPRIYFLDATKTLGQPPRVIVGYIGAHLTNTKTN
ncbi:hypothetical protein ACIQI7_32470 [Kitasatospora sp. NPDC092039]|uniref:hypothetical protein n=1 Tax=Kitasatospora sp. NPDC092039 TaxID=3364086 RepID=UPI00381796CA